MMQRVLVDGRRVERATLPIDDLGLGVWGVFEALRTYRREPFRIDAHLGRLHESARFCGVPWHNQLGAEIREVVLHGETRITLLLTGDGHRVVKGVPLDLSRVGAPVRVATRAWTPSPWLPGRVKHTNRLGWNLAVRDAGTDEVLFVSPEGTWTEANRSNVFVVKDGALLTPLDDGRILQGVTRDAMIEAAHRAGVEVREAPVPVGVYDEMYLCSTLKELAPVVELDGVPGPGGGVVGRRVMEAFRGLER